ncbi:3646_t:CDS:2 [Acaulospora morrowiae]|uniref:3646_t:CDS:1 n=1 Tax=Acaulospora morrowiae TaxID=94023 RepID=A0A9N9GJI2_9GLOM|nr:3646_t:CDS:2 [Acaulospora morrowiae]
MLPQRKKSSNSLSFSTREIWNEWEKRRNIDILQTSQKRQTKNRSGTGFAFSIYQEASESEVDTEINITAFLFSSNQNGKRKRKASRRTYA